MSKQFTLITSSSDYNLNLNSQGTVYYDDPVDDDDLLDIVHKYFGYIPLSSASNIAGMMHKMNVVNCINNKNLTIVFPETGLHPNTQSMLAAYLIERCIRESIQLTVITYSEHIFNAFRVAIARKRISNADFGIIFNDQEVQIDNDARIESEYWTEGFFDQSEKDLNILLG